MHFEGHFCHSKVWRWLYANKSTLRLRTMQKEWKSKDWNDRDGIFVTGRSLDSSEKGNLDKMSEKCRKNVRKMSKNCLEAQQTHNFRTFFGHFLPIWSVLLFGDPVQCSPVTMVFQRRTLTSWKKGLKMASWQSCVVCRSAAWNKKKKVPMTPTKLGSHNTHQTRFRSTWRKFKGQRD